MCASWVHSCNGNTAFCVQTGKVHAQLRRLRNESSVLKDAVITAIPSHYSRVFFTCARVTSPVRGVDFGVQQPAQSTDSGVSCHLKFLTFSNRGQHILLSGYLNFCHVFFHFYQNTHSTKFFLPYKGQCLLCLVSSLLYLAYGWVCLPCHEI